MKTTYKIIACLLTAAAFVSCKKETGGGEGGESVVEEGAPIEVVDGKVTFIVKSFVPLEGKQVKVNSRPYTVEKDGSGREYITVTSSSFGDYAGEFIPEKATEWYTGDSPEKNIFLPHGQFFATSTEDFSQMPMFALYREATGNVLTFAGPYALVRLNCRGEGKVASIAAVCTKGTPAGLCSYDPYTGKFTVSEKMPAVTLNCMKDGGAPMTGEFNIAVLPGEYKGLKLNVVSTDHRVCSVNVGDVTLSSGEVKTLSCEWNAGDNLFYEGFDNFVWGGDIMGGNSGVGYAPDASKPEAAKAIDRTGYEYAKTRITDCTQAGASYFEQYSASGNYPVMGEEYRSSRNMSDYDAVLRAQEFQGCIGVGTLSNYRGWLTTPFLNIPRWTDVKIEFDICPGAGIVDEVHLVLMNSGVATSMKVGGRECLETQGMPLVSANLEAGLPNSLLTVPASFTAQKKWTHVELLVDNASDNTRLKLISSTSVSGYHTFYVDNIRVTKRNPSSSGETYRMIYWNILYGMATDSDYNYDNFVEWVKYYNPDFCVWCEARSNSREAYYLPAHYPELAARYGHQNVVGVGTYHMTGVPGAGTEGFPQEVTSRHSIRKIKDATYSAKILGENGKTTDRISHGGGLVELNLGGRIIYVVPLHLIPRTTADPDAMDEYQENEIKAILDATILNPAYKDQKDWIMCGDFNSQSPGDKWYYDIGGSRQYYRAHQYILNNTDMIDVVQKTYANTFMRSTAGNGRIDYIYASPSVYKDIVRAGTLLDSFSTSYSIKDSPRSYAGYYPSDHRPLCIEIKK